METKTDQAGGASIHALSQQHHHQQQQQQSQKHPSSSSTANSNISNKGPNSSSSTEMIPAARQEVNSTLTSTSLHCDSSSMTPSFSSSSPSSSSSSQQGGESTKESATSMVSTLTSMTVSPLPLLATSAASSNISTANFQFTHQPYHHQHQHVQHLSSRLLEEDAEQASIPALHPVSVTSITPSQLQSTEEIDISVNANSRHHHHHHHRNRILAAPHSSNAFATQSRRDTRDPRSNPSSAMSKNSALISGEKDLENVLSRDQVGSHRPLQALECNRSLTAISSSFDPTSVIFKAFEPPCPPLQDTNTTTPPPPTSQHHHRQVMAHPHTSSVKCAARTKRSKQTPVTQGYSLEPSFVVKTPVDCSTSLQDRRRSSLGNDIPSEESKTKSSRQQINGTDIFKLQPVPACKRKRVSNSTLHSKAKASNIITSIEKRRRKENQNIQSRRDGLWTGNQMISTANTASSYNPTSLTHHSFDFHPVPLTSENSRGAAALYDSTKLWITPVAPHFIQSEKRISRPKLSRTQSLPNLKVKPVVDLSGPALHCLAMPPRLAEYLTLLRNHANRQDMNEVSNHPSSQQSPQSDRSYMGNEYSSGLSAQSSYHQFKSRNGFCSTAVDSLGNVKSIFVPSLHPPITRQTLKELDLQEILKNPQLRHDIVFDSNVQFRPNFDGERGKKKREIGNKYWFAVQREIESGCTCTSFLGKLLLPCACGKIDSDKEASSKFANSLSSVQSPYPVGISNYAHSGSTYGTLHSNGKTGACTPTTAAIATPMTSFGVRGSRVPSRLPLLIQELRAICLSVLPSPSSNTPMTTSNDTGNKTPASASKLNPPNLFEQKQILTPASGRSTITTPSICSSSVSTHHLLIAQALDANLITQQIQHGMLDIANLMKFLGSILKQHCAPMRDELIEKMIKTICEDGNIAMGLRMCFEILELMKLDIANHQLRSSRMYLIETAVDFENRWIREQLHHRKMGLDRTTDWYLSIHRRLKDLPSSTGLSRSELISASIDAGFMQLIFDPAHSKVASTVSNGEKTPLPTVILGVTPSSAIHSHPCINSYPETFQFDAFRLMSFHGDVTDITIVYMLLLLFRQLACSNSNLSVEQNSSKSSHLSGAKILENASKIANAQSIKVKSEIWTLLHEADLEITAAGGISQSAITLPMPRTPSATGIAARLLNQSAFTSSQKLENPAWRKAMADVILQIAARAIQVQREAREETRPGEDDDDEKDTPLPSEETVKLLTSWMDTNLRMESRLHLLCQQRIKSVIEAFLNESHRKQWNVAIASSKGNKMESKDEQSTSSGKKRSIDEIEVVTTPTSPTKRIRMEKSIISSHGKLNTPSTSTAISPSVEAVIQKGGLESFTAEIKLLSERITKVKTFHLRVFQPLYETMALEA